jgi:hypothetical protein
MATDDNQVGYKKPPVETQFKKGQSGNPSGRPKRTPAFLDDAVEILSAPVTGHANGREMTIPALEAVFRRQCRDALKGDNATLRQIIDRMLTLEPIAQQQAEEKSKAYAGGKEKLRAMVNRGRQNRDSDNPKLEEKGAKLTDQRMQELRKQADALAREERKRLIREAKKRENSR